MQFQPISLAHKEMILSFQDKSSLPLSDFNFTNLWIWRFAREIEIALVQDCLIIRTTYPSSEPYYFFPMGKNFAKALDELLSLVPKARFKSLSLDQAQYLKEHFKLSFRPNRDRFDYVYSIEELITLSGRKFHKKKNHLNKFLQNYPNFAFEEVSSANLDEIAQSYECWYQLNPQKDESLESEKKGIESLLQDFHSLSLGDSEGLFALKGGVLRIEGELVAFSFAEAISKESVVVHIEKANTDFVGVFQAINQQCLAHLWSGYLWANREEDLGIEGLRKAKLSYQPTQLLEKYEI